MAMASDSNRPHVDAAPASALADWAQNIHPAAALVAVVLVLMPAIANQFFLFQIFSWSFILDTIALSLMFLAGSGGMVSLMQMGGARCPGPPAARFGGTTRPRSHAVAPVGGWLESEGAWGGGLWFRVLGRGGRRRVAGGDERRDRARQGQRRRGDRHSHHRGCRWGHKPDRAVYRRADLRGPEDFRSRHSGESRPQRQSVSPVDRARLPRHRVLLARRHRRPLAAMAQ